MKRFFLVLATLAAAICIMAPGAEAAKRKRAEVVVTPAATWPWVWNWGWTGPWTVRDPKLATSNAIVGGTATGLYFGGRHHGWTGANPMTAAYVGTSVGCAAISPILGTLWLNRPLTLREAHVSTANCFLPFVGGWIVNAAFDAHPEWEPKPVKVRHRRR